MCVQILREPALPGRSAGRAILPGIRAPALGSCLRAVAAWIVRNGERGALRKLADDKRLLNDIGLTREQVLGETGKPFWRR
jgi:uncharacterized protein YjiS (DUF1127 family)